MIRKPLACLTALTALFLSATAPAQTVLDEYIAFDDGAFDYVEYGDETGIGWKAHYLKMTSQRWRDDEDVDCDRRLENSWLDACDLWQHELVVYVPDAVRLGSAGGTKPTAVLVISGGNNRGELSSSGIEFGGPFSLFANVIIAELRQVPNQPYFFDAEPGRERTEDELLAYSIDQFFATEDPDWPALAPMTKAAVKAMDTVQAFLQEEHGFEVEDFIVTGGSKRGWTTWLTAAVDDRIRAIMPASIEVHDLVSQLQHHHAAYGFFAPATVDYVEANLACQLETDNAATALELIDPNTYKDRYTMPKLVLNSAGDQFFTSDSSRFYFDGLPGPKQLRMAPNTDHRQSADVLVDGLLWILDALDDEDPGHHIGWTTDPDGTLRVTTNGGEEDVFLWQASNPDARDFRLESIGEAWTSTRLTINSSGEYVAPAEIPETGWNARLVEVRYGSLSLGDLGVATESYTTEIQVLPDILPHEAFDCSQALAVTEGLWWDPATEGQGMDVNLLDGELLFGPWYLYDEMGDPMWVTFAGRLEGTRVKGLLHESSGPLFGPGFDETFDPSEVVRREVGQASIAFLGPDHGVFHYGFGEEFGGYHRDLNIEQFDARPDGPYSGLWWNPEQSGHGLQFNQKDDAFFGTWYTYDESGQPLWFLYIGEMLDADSARADMYEFTGPMLSDGDWDKELVRGEIAGEILIEFHSSREATADITVNGVPGEYLLQPFKEP